MSEERFISITPPTAADLAKIVSDALSEADVALIHWSYLELILPDFDDALEDWLETHGFVGRLMLDSGCFEFRREEKPKLRLVDA